MPSAFQVQVTLPILGGSASYGQLCYNAFDSNLNPSITSLFQTGSVLGYAGGADVNVISTPTFGSGAVGGYAGVYGATNYTNIQTNNSPVTNDNPTSTQTIAQVQWNFFPNVPEESAPIVSETVEFTTNNRDMSRYKKVYSFTRQQPVRIRVFNR